MKIELNINGETITADVHVMLAHEDGTGRAIVSDVVIGDILDESGLPLDVTPETIEEIERLAIERA